MRALKAAYLLIGVMLLGVVIAEINVAEVGAQVAAVGFGFAAIVAVYFVAFAIDSVTWHLTIPSAPLDGTWAYRIWKVRMVGEAFNIVMPAAGMGGEPVKAELLKKHYGTGYREGTASLILAKTINLIALVVFLVGGFVLMIQGTSLPAAYEGVATTGLLALGAGVFLFFAVQRFGVTSLTGTWISGRPFGRRIETLLHHVRDMDDRLIRFYRDARDRFAVAILLALANWLLGVVEIYLTLMFVGRPVSWADAWIIEAVAQLVRTGTFFIPASIGAQEGAFLLVCGAITGSPSVGVAVSVVRRLREVIWIVWGLALGASMSLRPGPHSFKS
ncbi:MAG: lysylphosphatidylglycerol synthase transmembrane domain-containing protein [Rhodospirillales bacterium]